VALHFRGLMCLEQAAEKDRAHFVSAAPVAVPRSSDCAIAVSSRDRSNKLCRQRSGGSSSSDGKQQHCIVDDQE
jgi:hypothetical protein